ncbi:hypothetical protein CPHO_09005 [Corynebacterium phocae]|uniref:Bacteriophage abortive infection AbiH n=1 Tax=Corynebacterium phocae TaxID=161895 RepID=A0A1L7D501_9CORY|nr:AbiH family protein [Corynebacterium phocae]APT93002.1 hypothetical protein CPHO_09005 [Corynebacterium phocae]KAA8723341.1 hypothetical protein F4V58_08510 [Corynebacterium phocae]
MPWTPDEQNQLTGFSRYSKEQFSRLERQHNIMVFVGNGFDLQILQKYEYPADHQTTYSAFYKYLQTRNFEQSNCIFSAMQREYAISQSEDGHENWSDIEYHISNLVNSNHVGMDQLQSDLQAVQQEFVEFLQSIITPDLLQKLSSDTEEHGWSSRSLSSFLGDITDRTDFTSMKFPSSINHYYLFNFQFINFNYTPLLDNYIFLDKKQFNPLKNKTVDTHFLFRNDPLGYIHPNNVDDIGYSGYILTSVVHPHGDFNIPRSLLLGMDAPNNFKAYRDPRHKLSKPYWGRNNERFEASFKQADLFIIFGSSIGSSDGWWWRHIASELIDAAKDAQADDRAREFEPELIIYRRTCGPNETPESTVKEFCRAAGYNPGTEPAEYLASRIHVVTYNDFTPRFFLSTSN